MSIVAGCLRGLITDFLDLIAAFDRKRDGAGVGLVACVKVDKFSTENRQFFEKRIVARKRQPWKIAAQKFSVAFAISRAVKNSVSVIENQLGPDNAF